jgi:Spy/CpxP family protein refolding chaperone
MLTFNAYAQGDASRWSGGHRYENAEDFSKTLNLTPEQQEKIKKQESINREKGTELRDKLRDKRSELKAELEKPQINKDRIDALVAEIKTLTGEQLERRVDNIIFMKQVLTPEQVKKLQEKKNEKVKEIKRGK